MAVTRATFARSVTYTVHERPDPHAHGLDSFHRHGRREACSPATLAQRAKKSRQPYTPFASDAKRWVDCEQCQVEMRVVPSATEGLHYLVCPSCRARFASCYEEVFSARAGVKPRSTNDRREAGNRKHWQNLKARAEAFHRRVDENDPYGILGVPPRTPFEEVRMRYHELAALHHPDHGGDPRKMRSIISAYERIRSLVASSNISSNSGADRE